MLRSTLQADDLIKLIGEHLPDFAFERAERQQSSGQFNNVLCLDARWIFRFPKSAGAAVDLARELEILPRLHGRLPLPIPEPRFQAYDRAGLPLFMAYPLIPGAPLLREKFAALKAYEAHLECIARDLAGFLRALHAIPPAELGLAPAGEDALAEWTRIGDDIGDKLFPHMRSDARQTVARNFEAAMNDADMWHYVECLVHGDFGTGNILFRDGRVSGVIDFGFCGPGDPAQDLGALLASYGAAFVERVCRHYPALGAGLRRARFYQSNYALIQALYALRAGDEAEFEDGMRDYVSY